MKTWEKITKDSDYQSLPDPDKLDIKNQYWSNVIARDPDYQGLDQKDKDEIRAEFFKMPGIKKTSFVPGSVTARFPEGHKEIVLSLPASVPQTKPVVRQKGMITTPYLNQGGTMIDTQSFKPVKAEEEDITRAIPQSMTGNLKEAFKQALIRRTMQKGRPLTDAEIKTEVDLLKVRYSAPSEIAGGLARGGLSGITLGASDLVLDKALPGYITEAADTKTGLGKTAETIGALGGSFLTGAGIAKGLSKLSVVKDISNPFLKLAVLRGGTALVHGGGRNLIAYLDNKQTLGQALLNTGINITGSMLGMLPENLIKPGIFNLVGQVGVDTAFDIVTDIARGQADFKNLEYWKQKGLNTIPSFVFAWSDFANRKGAFKEQQEAVGQGFRALFGKKGQAGPGPGEMALKVKDMIPLDKQAKQEYIINRETATEPETLKTAKDFSKNLPEDLYNKDIGAESPKLFDNKIVPDLLRDINPDRFMYEAEYTRLKKAYPDFSPETLHNITKHQIAGEMYALKDEKMGGLGIYSGRMARLIAEEAFRVSRERRIPVSLVYMDVINQKGVNNHFEGNEDIADEKVLHPMFKLMVDSLKESGYAFRVSGDSVAALVPGKDVSQASGLFEAIKNKIDSFVKENGYDQIPAARKNGESGTGLTFGVVEYDPGKDYSTLKKYAEKEVFKSKLKRLTGGDQNGQGVTERSGLPELRRGSIGPAGKRGNDFTENVTSAGQRAVAKSQERGGRSGPEIPGPGIIPKERELTGKARFNLARLDHDLSAGRISKENYELAVKKLQENYSADYKDLLSNPKDPFYNIQRIGEADETKLLVKDTVLKNKGRIEHVVGKKLTHDEIIKYAEEHPEYTDDLITIEATKKIGAMNYNLRNRIAELARKGTMTPEFVELLIKDKAAGENIARLLEQRKILSNGDDRGMIMNKIIQDVYKQNGNMVEVIKAAQGVDFNNALEAAKFYRKFIKPKLRDWINLLRYNSMLSSFLTHFVNISANVQGAGIIAPLRLGITGGIDWLGSKFGRPREYYAKEGLEYAKEFYRWKNIKDAAMRFADTLSGKYGSTMQGIMDIPNKPGSRIEAAFRLPTRLLQAADEFFQTLGENAHLKALEYKESRGAAVKDKSKQAYLSARQDIFNRDFGNPDEGRILKAIETIPQMVLKLRHSDNPLVRTMSEFIFPFVKIPANIIKQGVEYTPLGFSTLWGAGNKKEQLAKAIMGSAIGIGTALLFASDRMTGAEPTDQKQKALFRAAGKLPWAVRIGNKWISYTKLHPALALNFALVAGLKNALDNKKITKTQAETGLFGLAQFMSFFADQSYVKNIGEFVSSTRGDIESPARFVSSFGQQLIPARALMGWVARIIDPLQRKADNTAGTIAKQFQLIGMQLPGVSMAMPPRLGPDGKPIVNDNRLLNAVSPLRIRSVNPDYDPLNDMSQEILRMNRYKDQIIEILQKGDMDKLKDLESHFTNFRYLDTDKFLNRVKSRIAYFSSEEFQRLPAEVKNRRIKKQIGFLARGTLYSPRIKVKKYEKLLKKLAEEEE